MKKKTSTLLVLILILTNFNIMVASAHSVIPSGEAVGVIINTEGLLVTETSQVTDTDGKSVNPAQIAGIKKGDRITAADGNPLYCIEDLANYVAGRSQNIVLTIVRSEKTLSKVITPIKTQTGYKLGIWVRDSTAGIGTITYIVPEDNSFTALGHGICDADTDDILTIRDGNIQKCNITEPTKGERGSPGELNGVFTGKVLGEINKNTPLGIFGICSIPVNTKPIEIADPDEIKQTNAYILANVDGKGVKKYSVEIKKILKTNQSGKNMVIEITDKELINITGGIVQGMSGSPIIQNGKLIGAVTHVFINNPKQGYGIFASEMLKKATN